jgi:hypothetical protein
LITVVLSYLFESLLLYRNLFFNLILIPAEAALSANFESQADLQFRESSWAGNDLERRIS